MADKIVVMNTGVIEQVGTPAELYDHPVNLFVASFIGSPSMNLLHGKIVADADKAYVDYKGNRLPCNPSGAVQPGTEVTFGVRPEHVHVLVDGDSERHNATVNMIELTGPSRIVVLDFAGEMVIAEMDKVTPLTEGQKVELTFQAEESHLFDTQTGSCIRRATDLRYD